MTTFIELADDAAGHARRRAHAELRARQWRAERRSGTPPVGGDVPGRIWTWDDGTSWLWVVDQSDPPAIGSLHCPADRIVSLWPEICVLAKDQGWRSLAFSAWADDAVSAAVLTVVPYEIVATKLQLDVSTTPPPEAVTLEPMSPERYVEFRERSIDTYVEDLVASDLSTDRAAARAEAIRITDGALTDGADTAGHWVRQIRQGSAIVGDVWVADEGERCFLYDIVVEEPLRGQGIGTQALRACAAHTREVGAPWLRLNVFGANTGALALYRRVGFTVTEQIVTLELS